MPWPMSIASGDEAGPTAKKSGCRRTYSVVIERDAPPSPRTHASRGFVVVIDSGQRSTEALAVANDFPSGFFARGDESNDADFYSYPRYVTHIDAGAIDAVGALYEELGVRGTVLDLMSSWVSHFRESPDALTVLGMNADELAANPQARSWVVHDLNADPLLPFGDDSF